MPNSIDGAELLSLFRDEQHHKKLFPGLIAPGPSIAVRRIASRFRVPDDFQPWEVEGIRTFRALIDEFVDQPEVCNGLAILAPHTHWEPALPIVYTFDRDKDRYLVGNLAPNAGTHYTPVSFVFSDDGPLPYEWCDSTIEINNRSWHKLVQVIEHVGRVVSDLGWPLGLGFDFRFKNSLLDDTVPTVELPVEESDHSKLSQVIRFSTFIESGGRESEIEQVSWTAQSEKVLGLGQQEQAVLTRLRQQLRSLETKAERLSAIASLQRQYDEYKPGPSDSQAGVEEKVAYADIEG